VVFSYVANMVGHAIGMVGEFLTSRMVQEEWLRSIGAAGHGGGGGAEKKKGKKRQFKPLS